MEKKGIAPQEAWAEDARKMMEHDYRFNNPMNPDHKYPPRPISETLDTTGQSLTSTVGKQIKV